MAHSIEKKVSANQEEKILWKNPPATQNSASEKECEKKIEKQTQNKKAATKGKKETRNEQTLMLVFTSEYSRP